jgi:lipoate-protein ligase A
LLFLDDEAPHAAALNMAIDEALLSVIPSPLLRVYRWQRPAVSFGYFQASTPILAAYPTRDAVRRWTGGGTVLHGDDLTYSILIPQACDAAALSPSASYEIIHTALASALVASGHPATPAASSADRVSQACFENPVLHDVLVGGRKVAGAAQRRVRTGVIHQGSIQTLALPPTFGETFAAHLSPDVARAQFDILPAASQLAAVKYATRAWLEIFP